MRLFFAVTLPDSLRQAIDDWMTALRRTGAHVTWVPAENLHVTLQFLGEIPEAQVASIVAAAAQAVSETPSFVLSVSGAGVFPPKGAPRVLWVGLQDGADTLELLAQRLNDALEPLGIARETKPFRAHLTIGRVKSPKGMKQALRIMEQTSADFGSTTVSSVTLQQSILQPTGAIYTSLQSFELTT